MIKVSTLDSKCCKQTEQSHCGINLLLSATFYICTLPLSAAIGSKLHLDFHIFMYAGD